jgi:hypothetical protein
MMKGFIEGDYCVPLYHIKRMEVHTGSSRFNPTPTTE